MADFNTHLTGAAAISGMAATMLVMTGIASHQAVISYFVLGVIGGLLPDIDSPTSIPIRIAFAVLAVVGGFMVVFAFGSHYSLVELVILWLSCFLLIRYGLLNLFTRATTHRGLIHSIPAGIGFGLATVLIAHHIFNATAIHAWFCGTFILLGFIVHLLLDECYSVNLYGKRLLKTSFGTAFNLGSLNQPLGTTALYLAVVGLFLLCPSPQPFIDQVLDRATYRSVAQRLWPGETWFTGFQRRITPPPGLPGG
jgi:Na+/proline symporter